MSDIPAPGAAPAAAPNGDAEVTATQITGDAPATPEAPKGPPKGVQKRIDELTANWRTTERDRDHWRELALKNQQAPAAPVAPQGKPTLEQFEFDQEKYLEALAEWKLTEREKANEKAQKEKAEADKKAKRTQAFSERALKYAEGKENLRSLVEISSDPSLPITEAMGEAILDSDDGPALLHYLDANRVEAARIAQLSPYQAALALGRIGAKLAAPPPEPEPQITAAPKPVPTVKPSAPTPKGLSDDLPVKEWLKLRNKQTAKGG